MVHPWPYGSYGMPPAGSGVEDLVRVTVEMPHSLGQNH